jgi:hypothetical protein
MGTFDYSKVNIIYVFLKEIPYNFHQNPSLNIISKIHPHVKKYHLHIANNSTQLILNKKNNDKIQHTCRK